jgi:hypothetical protein
MIIETEREFQEMEKTGVVEVKSNGKKKSTLATTEALDVATDSHLNIDSRNGILHASEVVVVEKPKTGVEDDAEDYIDDDIEDDLEDDLEDEQEEEPIEGSDPSAGTIAGTGAKTGAKAKVITVPLEEEGEADVLVVFDFQRLGLALLANRRCRYGVIPANRAGGMRW